MASPLIGVGASLVNAPAGGAAGFIYNLLKDFRTDLQMSSSGGEGHGNLPEGALSTKEATVRWQGLWYTHTRFFGLRTDAARRAIRQSEVRRNKTAMSEGAALDLGSVGLALPLEISYDVHRIDKEQVHGAIGERRAKLAERRAEAYAKLVKAQRQEQEALLYNNDRRGRTDHRLRRTLEANVAALAEQVDELDRQLDEVEVAIRDVELVRSAQTEGYVKYMKDFKIRVIEEYLGKRLYIPAGLRAEGTFVVTPKADHYNPHFEIAFTWKESMPVKLHQAVWADSFAWYPDRGPEGSGKFVQRFMTGARRFDEQPSQGAAQEEKARYSPVKDPAGNRKVYRPTPAGQKPDAMSANDLIAEFAGTDRDYDRIGQRSPARGAAVPPELRAQPPGAQAWSDLLSKYEIDPRRALAEYAGRRGHDSPRKRFYETVERLTSALNHYWSAFRLGRPPLDEAKRGLVDAFARARRATDGYSRDLRDQRGTTDRRRQIDGFRRECDALFSGFVER